MFNELIGKTITQIEGMEQGSDDVTIKTSDGATYRMWHSQDCCESVSIAEIIGDITDLHGQVVTVAEEVSNADTPEGTEQPSDSYTWTFYILGSARGRVTLRWLGESNGYYSESVNFEKIDSP